MSSPPELLATVELVGALAYAQLRAFQLTSQAVRSAPDVRAADRVAEFAVREHRAYTRLRDRLEQLTDLSEPPMDRQRARIDAFFDGLHLDGWVDACTFFAIGLPMAADFARAVAPALDDATAAAVVEALAERATFEQFAVDELNAALREHPEQRDHIRRMAAEVTGSALTEFQGAITDTDALEVLLRQLEENAGQDVLRHTAISLLEQHRRRMAAIGLDTPD